MYRNRVGYNGIFQQCPSRDRNTFLYTLVLERKPLSIPEYRKLILETYYYTWDDVDIRAAPKLVTLSPFGSLTDEP